MIHLQLNPFYCLYEVYPIIILIADFKRFSHLFRYLINKVYFHLNRFKLRIRVRVKFVKVLKKGNVTLVFFLNIISRVGLYL